MASPEPVRIGTNIAEANPTTTDSSRSGTRTNLGEEEAAVAVEIGMVDVLIRVMEEISRSIGISSSRVRVSDLMGIVPGVPVRSRMEDVVLSKVGINHLIEISKVRRNGLARRRVREIDNVEGLRTDHNMAMVGIKSISTGTREAVEEEVVANGSHLIRIRRMAAAAAEASGTTSHVVKMNITTKNRSKVWTTCSQRNLKS